MDSANKFVWAYMLKEGIETDGSWDYYGGRFGAANLDLQYNWEKQEKARKLILDQVRFHGIDWEKTKPPESDQNSKFEGTFANSSRVESLLGTLYLKNGTSYTLGVSNAEARFGDYVRHLSKLMEDKQMVKDILGEDI